MKKKKSPKDSTSKLINKKIDHTEIITLLHYRYRKLLELNPPKKIKII